MSVTLRSAVAGGALALAAMGLVPTTVAHAADPPKPGTSCTEQNTTPAYKSGSYQVGAAVYQLKLSTLPPRSSKRATVTVPTREVLSAGAKVSGKANTKVANTLIGQAEAKLRVKLQPSGASTRAAKTTVTATVANRSKRAVTFVFFRGAQTVSSGVLRSYCDVQGTDHFGKIRYRKVGTWQTFGVAVQGATACNKAGQNTVAREALRVGCS